MRAAAALLLAALALGCGAPPAAPPPRAVAPGPAPAAVLTPARYLLTDRLGVMFDEAGPSSTLPRAENAIVDGVRVVVDGGIVLASARHADRLSGFRSLPPRLGGGVLLWSEDRLYRAETFLAEPRALADVGATGGARPWLGSVLLRTPSGLLDLDPATLTLRRAAMPGVVEALALDARRAARLDVLGRASYTLDGGATWTDLLATRAAVVTSLREGAAGDLAFDAEPEPRLTLGPNGLRPVPAAPPASAFGEPRTSTPLLGGAFPATSRVLPEEIVADAVAYGALLEGGRLLVTRENGVRVLSAATGLPVADANLALVDDRFAHCQAVLVGAPPRAALACTGEAGAEVLELDGALSRSILAATFPGLEGGFYGGPRGRLAFDGGCGPAEPRGTDLGPGATNAESTDEKPPSPAPPGPAAPPVPDDARVCLRTGPSRWLERRLRGDDARRLYRWVPGDDGAVTALVFDEAGEPDAGSPSPPPPRKALPAEPLPPTPPEGVRVVHLDPEDPALGGAAFPAVPPPPTETSYHPVNVDFWQDDDGAVRGWVRLPPAGEERLPVKPSEQGPAKRMLPVAVSRDGRYAGLRIDAAGHLTVLPLPDGVTEVLTGGPFALAMGPRDGGLAWFETRDGGATWAPIEGPPTGTLEGASSDDRRPNACSPAGCAWAGGVVRLGWGGPPPQPAPELELEPAQGPRPRDPDPLALRCRIEESAPPWTEGASTEEAPLALRLPAIKLGTLHGHAWSAELAPPFQPTAGLRHLALRDGTFQDGRGAVVPVLTEEARAGVDLLLVQDKRRLRASAGSAALLPFWVAGTPSIAADGPGGALVALDADRGVITLSRGADTTPVVHLPRVAEVSRLQLTLAQKIGAGGGLAVVGYSASSGEVVAGDLDLGRAQVGPLAALGRLETAIEAGTGACGAGKAKVRFLAELPVSLRVEGRGGTGLFDQQVTGAVLIEAGAERLCVLGVEAALPKGSGTMVSALVGRGGSASVRSGRKSVRAVCGLGAGGR